MLAVDTNVVVRFLTRDDAAQFARADALIKEREIYISTTVLLETEWVLRSGYRYRRTRVVEALRDLAGLPRVRVEDAGLLAQALEWAERGMDFADALHLASAKDCEAFASFDRRLVRQARWVGGISVRVP